MKQRKLLKGLLSSTGMLILILDGKTALQGAQEGLKLCAQSVIPSLFPFIVLSILLNAALSGGSNKLLVIFGKLFRMPAGSESLLIPAFLGGYPVGAQAVGQAAAERRLSQEDGRRMLAYCSNAGPSFLFGMVGPILGSQKLCWICWGILILTAWLTSRIFPKPVGNAQPLSPKTVSLPQALSAAVNVMLTICGWVILFRILAAFFSRWFLWLLPGWAKVTVVGLLELSNGCWMLNTLDSAFLRFLLSCGMLSFGGLCVAMQTASVIGEIPLDLYLAGKAFQCILSVLLALAYLNSLWFVFPAVIFLIPMTEKIRKSSSIPQPVGV